MLGRLGATQDGVQPLEGIENARTTTDDIVDVRRRDASLLDGRDLGQG